MMTPEQQQLGKILQAIAEELDIPDSKYENAINKYEAVGDWLGRPDSNLSVFQPTIFAQGSFRLGTCVKPLGQDEYDIDLVCKLNINSNANQKYLYDLVGERLKKNGHYKSILIPKNRCWRLNYAANFHLDILPAILDEGRNDSSLLIPDRELEEWQCTNPEGYTIWFYKQMEIRRKILLKSAKAKIENIPEFKIKTPLQRAIQILKRHRDIIFKNIEDKPISIIITTLAAKAYNNESDLFEALINIIQGMPRQFDDLNGEVAVLNPTNKEENFADKWIKHPERKEKFLIWLSDLDAFLNNLLILRGFPQLKESLTEVFEEKIIDGAFKRLAEKNEILRDERTLKMDTKTGILGSVGISLRKNTFYGGKIKTL